MKQEKKVDNIKKESILQDKEKQKSLKMKQSKFDLVLKKLSKKDDASVKEKNVI